MERRERIETRLRRDFSPERVEVTDESSLHAGHAGARAGGETHYRVDIVSAAFARLSRVQRHRLVYEALADEIAGGVHALALHARAPGEP